MISKKYLENLQNELQNIENDGLYKRERIITSQQSAASEASSYTTGVALNVDGGFLS